MPLNKAKEWLAKQEDISVVLDLRDKASAIRQACLAAGVAFDVTNEAAEIKIRAERTAGELLKYMQRAKPGRPSKNVDIVSTFPNPPTYADLNIHPREASRLQTVATVPDSEFEKYIGTCKEERQEITSAAVRRLAKLLSQPVNQPLEEMELIDGVYSDFSQLPRDCFRTVYADPPWKYGNQATRSSTNNHYRTMSVDELCEIPVAEVCTDAAHLHLWTTNGFLPDAFKVIEAWGFEYKSCFVWVKPQMGIGNYWRVSHEFLLLGVRGAATSFRSKSLKSWGEYDRNDHSEKPEAVREMVEDASEGPYLELFGRRRVDGWTVFGNEVGSGQSKLFR